MHKLLHQHHISFKNAFAGLWWAVTTQPNFRVHLVVSAIALFLCYFLTVSPTEWAVIILAIVFGLGAEMVNTSLESMTDLITTEWRQQAKTAKDVAAGMMLVTAIGAACVGCVVFVPKLVALSGM